MKTAALLHSILRDFARAPEAIERARFGATIDEQIRAVEWASQMCVDRNLCGPYLAIEEAVSTLRRQQYADRICPVCFGWGNVGERMERCPTCDGKGSVVREVKP